MCKIICLVKPLRTPDIPDVHTLCWFSSLARKGQMGYQMGVSAYTSHKIEWQAHKASLRFKRLGWPLNSIRDVYSSKETSYLEMEVGCSMGLQRSNVAVKRFDKTNVLQKIMVYHHPLLFSDAIPSLNCILFPSSTNVLYEVNKNEIFELTDCLLTWDS